MRWTVTSMVTTQSETFSCRAFGTSSFPYMAPVSDVAQYPDPFRSGSTSVPSWIISGLILQLSRRLGSSVRTSAHAPDVSTTEKWRERSTGTTA